MLQSQAVFDPKQSFCTGCDSFWILLQATEGLQGRRMWHVAQLHGSQRGPDRITGQQPMELSNTAEEAQNAGITLDAGLQGCITVQQQSWLAAIAAKQGIKD